MSGKYALIIGNTEYTDSGLAQLTAPGKDAEDFARVLKSQDICDFDDVKISINQPSSSVIETIDEFFDQKKPDDLLILYFSGHGVKDEIGSLYLAFKNTVRSRLRSTAIKSDYIREAMDQSRSKRQVLILDCCNSGAFPQGTKAELGGVMGMTKAFQGYGRFVLTASDATQFAWEGDKFIGETDNSLFTHFLVKGLEGEADSDGDGKITVDEIYDYAFQQISKVTPKQTPTKSSSKQEGEIILRENMRIEDIKPIALSDDLINEIDDTRPYVREAAVQKLEKILKGKNIGLARSARESLEKIAEDENTTRRVAQLAAQAIASLGEHIASPKEDEKTKKEAERLAAQKAKDEKLTKQKEIAEQKATDLLAAQKVEEEHIASEKVKHEAIEKDAREKKQRKQEQDTAERVALEKANPEDTQKTEQKKPTGGLGGFGFLFIFGILIVGAIIAINWQSSPTTPTLTEAPITTKVLKVGYITEQTGVDAYVGAASVPAMQDYVDEVNAKGGVGGYKLELVVYDTRSEVTDAVAVAKRLMDQDKAVAIIGPSWSSAGIPLADIADAAKVPMVATTASNVNVTVAEDGTLHPYMFRVCFIDPYQGYAQADFAYNKLGLRKAALLTDIASPYTVGLHQFFKDHFIELGGEIVAEEGYTQGDAEFRAQLAKIKDSGADLLVVDAYTFKDVGLAAQQAEALGLKIQIMAGDGVFVPELLDMAGPQLEGAIVTTGISGFAPEFAEFNKAFEAKHSVQANVYTYYGLDALMAIEYAINAAAKKGDVTPTAVRDALETMTDVQLFTSVVTMEPDTHNPHNKPLLIMTIKDSQWVLTETFQPK